jgi:eukaryotic-like serine/threonine-protein kinase
MYRAINDVIEDIHRYRDLSALLDEALALPVMERKPWLHKLAPDHRPLAPLLHNMLARAELDTGSFMQMSAARIALDATVCRLPPDVAGRHVGPYRLLRLIGRGGMANVWLAERTDGVPRRKVALKLPHFFSRSTTCNSRMARERDILAALEHPHIARLYEAGFADKGRPYLAMEFVDGQAIDDYARARNSDVTERLRLMLQVMRAVEHAHAKQVLHSDLKPRNILVDGAGQVRLLDFGVADWLHGAQAARRTHVGHRACTPAYASPEQVRGEPLGVASDVYALGMLLYELIFGQLPRRPEDTTRSATCDATRSACTAPMADDETPLRSATPGGQQLNRPQRADLDFILSTALHEDPARRYPSVEQFASDIERLLVGDVVLIRSTQAWYRWRTSLLRYCNLSVAGAALAGLIVGFAGRVGWMEGSDSHVAAPTVDRLIGVSTACPHGLGHCVEQRGSRLAP